MGLDTVELVLAAETQFGVAVTDADAQRTETVGQFVELLCELRQRAGRPLGYDQVLQHLQQLIHERFAIPISRIVADARFVQDLGLDQ